MQKPGWVNSVSTVAVLPKSPFPYIQSWRAPTQTYHSVCLGYAAIHSPVKPHLQSANPLNEPLIDWSEPNAWRQCQLSAAIEAFPSDSPRRNTSIRR